MGFFNNLRKIITGTKEKAGDFRGAASRAEMKVDNAVDKSKRAADTTVDNTANDTKRAADKADNAVDSVAGKSKRAADKADNAVDNDEAASDELKKE